MANTPPAAEGRRHVHTALGLPRLASRPAGSTSEPHTTPANLRVLPVEMSWRNRPARLDTADQGGAFHLDSPQASRPLDLQLPGPSKSLSSLVVHANLRQRDQHLQLQGIDQLLVPISRPMTSPDTGDSGALATKSVMDDIGELLAKSSAVYAMGKKPLSRDAKEAMLQQSAREQKATERETQERRRESLQRKVAVNTARNSVLHLEILEKIEDLRGDHVAQGKFEAYISSIRPAPEQRKVKENIRAVSKATPADFARTALERQAAKRHALEQRRKQARQHYEVRSEERLTQLLSLVEQRHEQHQLGIQRQRAVSGRARALMWLTLVQLHHRTALLGDAVRAGRQLRERRQNELRAVTVIKKQFRLMVLRTRFYVIHRGIKILRRLVWWWRFRSRIKKKRAANHMLLTYLRAHRLSSGAMLKHIKRFIYRVSIVQRCWQLYWVLLTAQAELVCVHWSAVDERQQVVRRQDSATWLDPHVRLLVVRDDLRKRKQQHGVTCSVWQQDMATWEEQWQQEHLMLRAKGMFTSTPSWTAAPGSGQEGTAEETAAQLGRRIDADLAGRRARLKRLFSSSNLIAAAGGEAAMRSSCLLSLERRGVVHPGPRPLFKMFVSEDQLALLESKVRAKMDETSSSPERHAELPARSPRIPGST